MMPPEGGYDHAPMTGDMVMPEPFVMATPDPTGELAGSENIAPGTMDGPSVDPTTGEVVAAPADDGGMGALDGAMGGDSAPVGSDVDAAGATAMDEAVGSAFDSSMDQGAGGPAAPVGDDVDVAIGDSVSDASTDDVDPSAGMG
jgi:hypothetical protein